MARARRAARPRPAPRPLFAPAPAQASLDLLPLWWIGPCRPWAATAFVPPVVAGVVQLSHGRALANRLGVGPCHALLWFGWLGGLPVNAFVWLVLRGAAVLPGPEAADDGFAPAALHTGLVVACHVVASGAFFPGLVGRTRRARWVVGGLVRSALLGTVTALAWKVEAPERLVAHVLLWLAVEVASALAFARVVDDRERRLDAVRRGKDRADHRMRVFTSFLAHGAWLGSEPASATQSTPLAPPPFPLSSAHPASRLEGGGGGEGETSHTGRVSLLSRICVRASVRRVTEPARRRRGVPPDAPRPHHPHVRRRAPLPRQRARRLLRRA